MTKSSHGLTASLKMAKEHGWTVVNIKEDWKKTFWFKNIDQRVSRRTPSGALAGLLSCTRYWTRQPTTELNQEIDGLAPSDRTLENLVSLTEPKFVHQHLFRVWDSREFGSEYCDSKLVIG